VLTFSTGMKTVGSAGDYQVFWDSTRRVKKKLTQIPHQVAVVSAMPNAANTTVTLMTGTPISKFSKGWQVTIVSPGSIVGTDGVALGGPTTFQV
jgi:hypothetical protein